MNKPGNICVTSEDVPAIDRCVRLEPVVTRDRRAHMYKNNLCAWAWPFAAHIQVKSLFLLLPCDVTRLPCGPSPTLHVLQATGS